MSIRSTPNAAAAAKPTTPQSTCSMRNSCTVLSMFARSRRRRTDVAPPSTRSTVSAAERSSGPNTPAAADVGESDVTRSAGLLPTCGRSRT